MHFSAFWVSERKPFQLLYYRSINIVVILDTNGCSNVKRF